MRINIYVNKYEYIIHVKQIQSQNVCEESLK